MADIDHNRIVKEMYRTFDKKNYYSITPNIVASHTAQELTIYPKFKYYRLTGRYAIIVWPLYHFDLHPSPEQPAGSQPFLVTAVDNTLRFIYEFAEEQEYMIRVSRLEEGEEHLLFTTSVYALDEDLYYKKPLKGDLHIHTTYSDGFEPPEITIASARKCGFDFIGVADHNNYEGSVQAEATAQDMTGNLLVIRGEEFSCQFAPIHILSLGAPEAVAPKYYEANAIYSDEVIEIATQARVYGIDPLIYAGVQNLLNQIRKSGGFSVLCHPFWKYFKPSGVRNDTPLELFEALIANRNFDGLEIISGSLDSQTSMLQDTYLKSKFLDLQDLPVIGISDSHTTLPPDTLFGSHYTIVFADEFTAGSILGNLRRQYSVAVEKLSDTCHHVHGNFRLSKYAYFLLREYFPMRDRVAYLEGELLFFDLFEDRT